MYNIKPLENSMKKLGFTKQSNQNVSNASIETMKQLLKGHRKAKKISRQTISRYAAALIGHYRGILPKPNSMITQYKNLNNFINKFVKSHFFQENGKIHNIPLFQNIFGVRLSDKRVSLKEVMHHPSPEKLLKYSIQKRPISNFKTNKNLEKIKQMNSNEIKLLLTPVGSFNPKLEPINQERALQYALALTKKFGDTIELNKRLKISTLIQQLQTTQKLNNKLLENIRTYS